MNLARIRTSTICGVEAVSVDVEVQIRDSGKMQFNIIGLADSAVRESRDRVLAALQHSGFQIPNQILVSLAPAEIKKEGSSFDLPIALAILRATGQINSAYLERASFHGELSLNGALKGVRGAVSLALKAHEDKRCAIVVPKSNLREASLIRGLKVHATESLAQTVALLRESDPAASVYRAEQPQLCTSRTPRLISDVRGQSLAKRALVVAAAGGHNVLMIGPPGCGKSMLAERFGSLLPALSPQEILETVRIYSASGLPLEAVLNAEAPFRNPHHVISEAGLVGGGSQPRAGEVSLAHRGVLFLDEFPEFNRNVLEALRAPLETGRVTISRARANVTLPAVFQLIAAMNPCPCGRLGSGVQECVCSRSAIQKYLSRLSGPILDRIDLHVGLEAVPFAEFKDQVASAEREHLVFREQVDLARARQLQRQECLNARVGSEVLAKQIKLQVGGYDLLEKASKSIGLSARGNFKVLRVAQTLADLEGLEEVSKAMLAEALSYRSLDRLKRYCE